ncbi:MAG: bacteriophage holin [Gammaproteobacteria bacterium]|nr:bacteriophage holin [Gammaproteobacteria bacterium]
MANKNYAAIHPMAFGLAIGVLWALWVSVAAIIVVVLQNYGISNYAASFVKVVASIYPGYQATMQGALIGAMWAFFDGFVGGVILAWLYNFFGKPFFNK